MWKFIMRMQRNLQRFLGLWDSWTKTVKEISCWYLLWEDVRDNGDLSPEPLSVKVSDESPIEKASDQIKTCFPKSGIACKWRQIEVRNWPALWTHSASFSHTK